MTRRLLILPLLLAAAAACDGAGAPTGIGAETARVRAFNAVVNRNPQFGGSVDVLVDGSAVSPGAPNLAPGAASAYAEAPARVLSFHARLTGDARPAAQSNLLRSETRLRVAGGFDYTLFVVGVVPPAGVPAAGAVAPLPVADDPFPPSRGADGRLQARVRLVNAAPFAAGTPDGTLLSLFITPGAEAPESLFDLAAQSVVGYRQAGGPVELPPGTYRLTVARTLTFATVAEATIELAPGAARTLVVVSDAPTADPSPEDHRIVPLTDRDFR